ncbi:MAG: hypothetical protein LAP85_16180 [Acidobacteriia bacterium]|nr:hypothetical protein [Terriglobia bacterium]
MQKKGLLCVWVCALVLMPHVLSQQRGGLPASSNGIYSAAFSHDGNLGAFVQPGTLTLVQIDPWKVRWNYRFQPGSLQALTFSPDGTRIVICIQAFRSRSAIGEPLDPYVSVQVLETSTGRVIAQHNGKGATSTLAICIDAGNSVLAVVARLSIEVLLWNVSTGNITVLYNQPFGFRSAALTPAGNILALAVTSKRGLNEYEVNLYDPHTGKLLGNLSRGSSQTQEHPLAFSSDGGMLAFGTEDWNYQNLKRGEIRMFEMATRKLVRTIRSLNIPIHSLLFQDDGQRILGLGSDPYELDVRPALIDRTLRIWDVRTGNQLNEYELENPAGAMRSMGIRMIQVPGKELFCTIGSGGLLLFYHPGNAQVAATISPAELSENAVSQGLPAPVPAGRSGRVVSAHRILTVRPQGDGRLFAASDDGNLYFWDLTGRMRANRSEIPVISEVIALSPDGKSMAVAGSPAGTVIIRPTSVDAGTRSLAAFSAPATALAFSADGAWFAAGATDGAISVFRTDNWQPLKALAGHAGAIRALAFSPDSAQLASGDDDLAVRVWNLKSAEVLHVLTGHKKRITAVAFRADGTSMASSSADSTVMLWDVRAGKMIRKLSGHPGPVHDACFSPDGSMLVSGGDDGVRLWDPNTGKLTRILLERRSGESPGPPVTKGPYFAESITTLSFSPDGKVLACGGGNNSLVVWDTATWKSRPVRAGNGPPQAEDLSTRVHKRAVPSVFLARGRAGFLPGKRYSVGRTIFQ